MCFYRTEISVAHSNSAAHRNPLGALLLTFFFALLVDNCTCIIDSISSTIYACIYNLTHAIKSQIC